MSNFIDFEDQRIHFTDSGKGKALVLLHGFLESLKMWDDFTKELSTQFRVIAIDLPGHGRTEVFRGTPSMQKMAASVKAVLDHLKIESCVMIGHSMGGYVTLEFAYQFPHFLRGISLFHSQASADTEEAKENRRRTINIVKLNKAGFINQFIPDLFADENVNKFQDEIKAMQLAAANTPAEGIIYALEAMRDRTSKIDLLLNLNIPILFIAGKEDPRIPVQNVMAQAILPRHSEVLLIGNVGHMGFVEARDETLAVLKCFVSRTI
ncbi:MAG: alpha/beta hydrolase [Bacteroidales bacterium]|nr:alpha/beta hydrolase [Bacteroidales bacterium]